MYRRLIAAHPIGCFFLTILACLYCLPTVYATPYKDFSQLPQVSSLQLSPDGKNLAYLRNHGTETLLISVDLQTQKSYAITKTDNERYKFRWIKWANNNQLVFSAAYPGRRYGYGTHETRLMVANKHEAGAKELLRPKKPTMSQHEHPSQLRDNVIDWLPDDPEHIMVSVDFETPIYPTVYKVNLSNRSRDKVQGSFSKVMSWQTDQQHRIRIGHVYDSDKGLRSTRILDIDNNEWHEVWVRDALFDSPYRALGFGLDPHTLYLRANHQGRNAIFTIDTRNLDEEPQLKASDPVYDIEGALIYSDKTLDVIGVYHGRGQTGRIYWDNHYQRFHKAINSVLPETSNYLTSISLDEKRYIVYSTSATSPGTYFFGDRTDKSLTPLFDTYPQLQNYPLSEKQRRLIHMRDNLTIEAYLSLPPQFKGKPIPAIILPHGGPMARDTDSFGYWVQFLTAKGWAVLQPNFRGSSGFGHDFLLQAVANYGLGMQDDLVDSTQWLIDEGIADSKRICIVGASYGGYAALTAAFKTPELYQCAVSFAGVSDLLSQRNLSRGFVNRAIVQEQYGKDDEKLKENSAFYNVDKISTPILLVHGDLDRVVIPEQSRKLAEKLERAGKEFDYIELDNGNHSLSNQKNRTHLFSRMDSFLEKHIGL